MKKNYFLLLLLTAILPMTGWCADGNTFTATYKGVSLTYTILSESEKTCETGTQSTLASGANVTIPSTINGYIVTGIGYRSFRQKTLKSISIPSSVISIGTEAFEGCSSLSSVTMSNGVQTIEWQAFKDYIGLTTVSIPNSVTSIGNYAFNGCSGLKDVYCYAKEVPNTNSSAFYPSKNTTLHVPVASVDSYKVKSPWYKFEKIVPIGERCATPTISFANGKVKVACATEGTKCVTSIVMAENQTSEDGEIDVSPAFTVSTYATAEGYEDSEVVTATFSWPKAAGDLNEDGHIDISDVTTLVNIILGK